MESAIINAMLMRCCCVDICIQSALVMKACKKQAWKLKWLLTLVKQLGNKVGNVKIMTVSETMWFLTCALNTVYYKTRSPIAQFKVDLKTFCKH